MSTVSKRIFEGPGFVQFDVHAVVKFGGSLLVDLKRTRDLVTEVEDLTAPIVVFPGGGPMDDIIHDMAERTGLDDASYCNACLRAVDQTGYLLCAWGRRMVPAGTLAQVRGALTQGQLPVLVPSDMIISLDLFTQSNVITSDTLGSFFAHLLGADVYVVATDVDGICEVDDRGMLGPTRPQVKASELIGDDLSTSVDACLAHFARCIGLDVVVVNGNRPGEVASAVQDGVTPWSTRILPI